MKQKQKKAAKAALGCLVLLLLYGCASHGGEAKGLISVAGDEVREGFSWSGERASDADEARENGSDPSVKAADEKSGARASGEAADSEANADAARVLAVYVCGAVRQPGVYELSAGSRVYEAVAMAGGMTKEASACGINQAEKLTDGQMVVVPTKEEAERTKEETREASDGLVNINTADAEELKTLSGIGDAKAAAIIAYREKNGAFTAISDIKKVDGIGDGVFAKLEDYIKVDGR